MVGKSQAEMFRGEKPIETKLAPEWTLGDIAKHAVDFWLSSEDLPVPHNRVTLDHEGNIHLAYKPSNPAIISKYAILGSARMFNIFCFKLIS